MQNLLVFLGRFHVVVLHFPIGIISVLLLVEAANSWKKTRVLDVSTWILWCAATLSAILASSLGWMLSSQGGYDEELLFWHQWLGTGVAVSIVGTSFFRWRHARGKIKPWGYWLALSFTIVLLILAGHDGGSLTHGRTYLTEHMPKRMGKWLGLAAGQSVHGGKKNNFSTVIKPILERKCYACHGVEKHKGEYRLDQRIRAMKGGKSEETAIEPGKPWESHLVELILLPEDDEDVMPPEGKTRLTGAEIVAIMQWIQSGADWGEAGAP